MTPVSLSPYININVDNALNTAKSDEKLWQIAKTATIVAAIVIAGASIVGTALFAPPIYSVLTALAFANPYTIQLFQDVIIQPIESRLLNAQEAREVYADVQERLKTLSDTDSALREIGIEPNALPSEQKEAVRPMIARYHHWTDVAKKTEEVAHTFFAKEDCNSRLKGYKKEELEVLPAKLKAAFTYHLIKNPTESRRFPDFGKIIRLPYHERCLMRDHDGKNPYFAEQSRDTIRVCDAPTIARLCFDS